MHCRTNNRRKYGFTLIELLVVIAIIAILAAILSSPADSSNGAAGRATDGNVSLLINDLLAHVVPSDANGYADMVNQHKAAVGLSQAAVNAPADCVLLAEGHCGWDKVNSTDG